MTSIDSLLERPRAYYNIDGVGELSTGSMVLAFALVQWIQTRTPGSSHWHQWSIFIVLGAISLIHYGSAAIKNHITYPRTGYVEYPRASRRTHSLVAATLASIFAVGLYVAVRSHWSLSAPITLIGLVFPVTYAYGFARTVPWKWIVCGVLAFGSLLIAILPPDPLGMLAGSSWLPGLVSVKATAAILLSFLLYGVALLVSGGISLWLYLRRTQSLAGETR